MVLPMNIRVGRVAVCSVRRRPPPGTSGTSDQTTNWSNGGRSNRVLSIVMSRYHDFMTKQTTVRLPEELADEAETVARIKGMSVNQLIVDSLAAEIDRVRSDKDFTSRAKRLLTRDKELLDRLAK